MEKDFDSWNIQKKEINERQERVLFHEREIWWCALGINIGYEQDGKNETFERPVLVMKKFNREVLLVLPLTRSNKSNRYYYKLKQGEERDSVVILSQIRLVSSKRLLRKMRMVSKKEFNEIAEKFKEFLPQIV